MSPFQQKISLVASAFRRGRIGRTVGSAALAIGAAWPGPAPAQAATDVKEIACRNPVSGATWRILIDYANKTADSNPATITPSNVRWRDAKNGGNYKLDLSSGELEIIIASSTGGWIQRDQCDLKP